MKWTLALRSVATFFLFLSMVLFIAEGARPYAYGRNYYYSMAWDIISMPIVRILLPGLPDIV